MLESIFHENSTEKEAATVIDYAINKLILYQHIISVRQWRRHSSFLWCLLVPRGIVIAEAFECLSTYVSVICGWNAASRYRARRQRRVSSGEHNVMYYFHRTIHTYTPTDTLSRSRNSYHMSNSFVGKTLGLIVAFHFTTQRMHTADWNCISSCNICSRVKCHGNTIPFPSCNATAATIAIGIGNQPYGSAASSLVNANYFPFHNQSSVAEVSCHFPFCIRLEQLLLYLFSFYFLICNDKKT